MRCYGDPLCYGSDLPETVWETKTMVHEVVGMADDHSSGPAYYSTAGPTYNSNLVNELWAQGLKSIIQNEMNFFNPRGDRILRNSMEWIRRGRSFWITPYFWNRDSLRGVAPESLILRMIWACRGCFSMLLGLVRRMDLRLHLGHVFKVKLFLGQLWRGAN